MFLTVIKNKKGTIFMTVMVVAMLIVFIAVAASNMLLQDAHLVRHLKYSTKALFIADAGISKTLTTLAQYSFLAKDTEFPLTDNVGDGSYTVTVSESGGRVLFTSIGTVSGVSRTVALEIRDNTPSALYYMMTAGNDMRFRSVFGSVADFNGDLHANHDVRLRAQIFGNIDVDVCPGTCCSGNVTASNKVYLTGDVDIAGIVAEYEPIIEFPTFYYGYYMAQADDSGDYYSSNTSFGSIGSTTNLSPGNGVIYVDGTATIYGTCNLYGGIVADRIRILGQLNQIKTGTKNVIIAKNGSAVGDIEVFGRIDAEEALVFATRDFTTLTAGSYVDVTGTLMAGRNVRAWDFLTTVIYTHALLDPEGMLGPGGEEEPFKVVSWNR